MEKRSWCRGLCCKLCWIRADSAVKRIYSIICTSRFLHTILNKHLILLFGCLLFCASVLITCYRNLPNTLTNYTFCRFGALCHSCGSRLLIWHINLALTLLDKRRRWAHLSFLVLFCTFLLWWHHTFPWNRIICLLSVGNRYSRIQVCKLCSLFYFAVTRSLFLYSASCPWAALSWFAKEIWSCLGCWSCQYSKYIILGLWTNVTVKFPKLRKVRSICWIKIHPE